MKKWQKFGLLLGIILALVLFGSLIFLKSSIHQPTNAATKSAQKATETDEYLVFNEEKLDQSRPMVIFYPGALVESESYSIWAEKLAMANYPVFLLKVPLDLALLDMNQTEAVLRDHPEHEYVIGGHSLGGVVASRFAKKEAGDPFLKGIFYLASYPDKKGDLSDSKLPAIQISATEDRLITKKDYQQSAKYLSPETQKYVIQGGNHAGFGSYRSQKGDGEAKISNREQQEQISELLLNWLDGFDEN